MLRKVLIVILLVGLVVLLQACIAVEEEIDIKLDGSGTIYITYKVAKMMYTNVKEGKTASVYPITPQGIKKVVANSPDLELKDVHTETKGKLVIIKTKIKFKRFNALTQPGSLYQLKEGEDYYEARIRIRNKKKSPSNKRKRRGALSQEDIDKIILENLKEYKNKLIIRTPTPIIDSNADYWEGREAKWEIPSAIFYKGGEDIVVWVRYKKRASIWDRIRDIFR